MSSTEGSETDDERDYHDFLFSKGQKKASTGDYAAAEKTIRQLLKKGGSSYLQPGTDRHYNTTSLMVEVLKGQGKLEEALEICETSISEIETLLGPENLLCSMLKEERDELQLKVTDTGNAVEGDGSRDVQNQTEQEAEASTASGSTRNETAAVETASHPTLGSESEVLGGGGRYYETMVMEPPARSGQVETAAMPAPSLQTKAAEAAPPTTNANPMETAAIEPKSILYESSPLIERRRGEDSASDGLKRLTLMDNPYSSLPEVVTEGEKEVLPAVEEEKEAVDLSMLSPTQASAPKGNRVSRSTSVFRAKDDHDEKSQVAMNPYDLSTSNGLVWPPWDENSSINILIVGDSGCGKTMVRRRLLRTFTANNEYTPTPPEHSLHAGRLYDGAVFPSVKIMEVSDLGEYLNDSQTAGGTSPRLDSEQMLRRMALTQTDLYVVCFNVNDARGLHNIEMKWHPQLQRLAQSRIGQAQHGKTLSNVIMVACRTSDQGQDENFLPSACAMTARYLNAQYFDVTAESWDDSVTDLSKAIGQLAPKIPANIEARPAYKILMVGDYRSGVTYMCKGLVGTPWKPVLYGEPEHVYDLRPLVYRSSNGEYYRMDLWDTLGVEDYDGLRAHTYPGTHIICYCFSIAGPDSWDNIWERWYPMITNFLPKVPRLVIGLQKDRSTNEKYVNELAKYSQKPVTWEQGEELRAKIGAVKYIETSLVTGEGLFDVKETLVDIIKKFPAPKDSSIRKSISVRNIFKRK